ncbi:MAG TPA: ribonuclease III [Steroidobacteraceae bacterium]|nr:ribonuclease III [Steroidobacteraceae bacterium]
MKRADWPQSWLRQQLGYVPKDVALFERALRHRSAAGQHNERLEFLGDAVLGLIVAEHLYERFPDIDEGALSRLRARIVSGESLARVAAQLAIGEQLELGPGELKTGGHRRESILADGLESVCGALFLDGGLEAARRILLQVLAPQLALVEQADAPKDAKTRLQEWLQGRGLPLPRYDVQAVSGEPHAQSFEVSCEVTALGMMTQGQGSSRRRAEQLAAEVFIQRLESSGDVAP